MVKKGCDEKRHGPKGSVSGNLWGKNDASKYVEKTSKRNGRKRRKASQSPQ